MLQTFEVKYRFMKRFFFILLTSCVGLNVLAQKFEDYFEDKTLRLDYIFAGTNRLQELFLDQLSVSQGWAGRRYHLKEKILEGNGLVIVCDEQSGDTLYCTSFSSLFQEWQLTEEATKVRKSFENCFLIPFPKNPVVVTLYLKDTHQKVSSTLTHRVDPKDILIRKLAQEPTTPYRYIYKNGDSKDCIDVIFVAEGYTQEEMESFYADAKMAADAILAHNPFNRLKDKFNFVAAASPSRESGISIPGKGIWKDTAVKSHYDTFYMERYLTTLHLKELHNLLAGIPYEHIVILANTDNYGGGGVYNSYTLSSAHHATFKPVVVHEFGHSFGGLADEYFYDDHYEEYYPSDTEPWEQNITTLVDFESKWKDMLPKGTKIPTTPSGKKSEIYSKIGVYVGAGYQSKGTYRPVQECRMKINDAPDFCPVCCRALERLIHFYTEKQP